MSESVASLKVIFRLDTMKEKLIAINGASLIAAIVKKRAPATYLGRATSCIQSGQGAASALIS